MCCKSSTGPVCGSIISASVVNADSIVTGTWTPAFSGNYGSSFYTSQAGTYFKSDKILSVNFQIIVELYRFGGSNPTQIDLPLPFMTSSLLTNAQFVNLNAYQGVTGAEFTPLPVFGIIQPGSQILSIYPNFQILPGDQWVGNFSIALS